MNARAKLYKGAARVRKIEHDELLREIADARETLAGWADRFAATPGDSARYLTGHLDAAAARAAEALMALSLELTGQPWQRPDDEDDAL